jgi:hypothetical protein
MASHVQIGSVAVDAFQWPGGTGASVITGIANLPYWAKALALHTPGDGTLCVPTWQGTVAIPPLAWVVRTPNGTVEVLSAAAFTALYN